LVSTAFTNNTIPPIITIHNMIVNGVNTCSIDGSPGGPVTRVDLDRRTGSSRTFVVVAYDVTAAFNHWGMYNISGRATGLPENAGVPGSPYGAQIINDFFIGAEYDGPCPPTNVAPFVHHYLFIVYPLDIELNLTKLDKLSGQCGDAGNGQTGRVVLNNSVGWRLWLSATRVRSAGTTAA